MIKKVIFTLVAIAIIFFLYLHQGRTLTTGEAIVRVMEQSQDPPKEWQNSIPENDSDLKEIPPEHIRAELKHREGFWNEFLNRKQWEVTIKYGSSEPTIVLDAEQGNLLIFMGR
ncbi:hypothetical protein DRW41_08560 [Neobacillus piezotolerans]|uniref:PepSY domain-containing protein n=1 Tax=Neobacillus piezotolerans TaxID=2259171 RepID=A0A3D8GTS8_9BACI|nr:hypothetical protein [Neobacillus piezotolerans]RDU37858.1 hypothetical protein DRW41_08560 [Neobacillus piezotolerans]